jgi:hypothetical protein
MDPGKLVVVVNKVRRDQQDATMEEEEILDKK